MLVRYYPRAGAFVTACMIVAMCAPVPSGAAEWSLEPSVRAGREYNDNIRYTLRSHSAVYGTSVEPILNMGVSSDIWNVNGNIDYTRKRYTPVNDLDSDDHRFTLSSIYKTERSVWQLSGTSAKTSLVTEQALGTNTGLVQLNRIQDSRSIGPVWTWSVTELTSLRLSYQVSNVSYVNGESFSLYDYRQQSSTISLLKQINPQDLASLDMTYSYYRVPKTGIVSRSANIETGLTSQFTETLKGKISIGLRNTTASIPRAVPIIDFNNGIYGACFFSRFDFYFLEKGMPDEEAQAHARDDCLSFAVTGFTQETQRVEETKTIYTVNLEKKFESVYSNLKMTRSLEPTATGAQSRVESLNIWIGRQLTEKFMAGFSVNAYVTNTLGGNVKGVDSRIYQLEPRLSWRWTQEVNVDGSYRYGHLKRDSENVPVIARSVYLTLTYQWPKMSISP